jgi:hypothetical protein
MENHDLRMDVVIPSSLKVHSECSPMKTHIAIAGFLLCLTCALGAPPPREEVSTAIAQIETNLVSEAAVDAAKVVLNFAEQSKNVEIRIAPETIPWLHEKWGLEPDREQSIRSMLLAAYIAGNTKSQLAAKKRADDPYAGWIFVCRGYAQFRAKVSFSSPSIDSLEKRRTEGTLQQHARDILKKGEPDGSANGSQPPQLHK